MPQEHVVRQGECLATIARRYGIPDWRDIYDHGDNAELRRARPDPHVLYPGDRVQIPEVEIPTFECGTEQKHRFKLERNPLLFRMRLANDADEPRGGIPYVLTLGRAEYEGTTPASGIIEHEVEPDVFTGTLRVWLYGERDATPHVDIPVQIGSLDPIETVSGVQARLSNLGVFDGAISDVLCDATRAALLAFQERHGLTLSGEIDGATKDKLKSLSEDH